MISLLNSTKLGILFAVLLCALFWQLGSWGVIESSEARYSEISREMLETGNWLKPQYMQIMHFDKPLMTYWITAIGLKIFGVNAFGARFFLQVAYLLQIFLVYKITIGLFDQKRLAIFAAFLYCGIPLVLISVRNLTTDAYLNTFALLAVLCYLNYYKKSAIKWLYFYFCCLGLTILTKGPFGLLLPLLAIYPIQKLLNSKPNIVTKIKSIHIYLGILLAIIVGGWWFFYLMYSSPKFYNFFVNEQLINRVANADTMKRSKPFWYYFALLPLFVLPQLSLFIGSLRGYLKQKKSDLKWLILMSIVLPLLLFSLSSSKLILYILPIMPFIAIISAYYLYHLEDQKVKGHFIYIFTVYSIIALALIVLCFGFVPQFNYQASNFQFVLILLLVLYFYFILYKLKNYKHKILLSFLILPIFLIPISTDLLKKLEVEINPISAVTSFIKSKHMEHQNIIVWNRAINAICFDLQRQTYSVKYDHYSLLRNTNFQLNFNWEKHLIDAKRADELSYLNRIAQSPSVLITRDGIPEKYSWLLSSYNQQKAIGKWTIYYKKQ
ncbi:4-amino-4-deoxy-L-arabinose transferase-like glycosyltransferase [Pedobacter sp. CG_S7]|uniref:ArnT family glycosyltransferase n=1 Tax=Pedobacter sp. CG_S7 TaxID=3143930 RepID=UPI003398F52A